MEEEQKPLVGLLRLLCYICSPLRASQLILGKVAIYIISDMVNSVNVIRMQTVCTVLDYNPLYHASLLPLARLGFVAAAAIGGGSARPAGAALGVRAMGKKGPLSTQEKSGATNKPEKGSCWFCMVKKKQARESCQAGCCETVVSGHKIFHHTLTGVFQ